MLCLTLHSTRTASPPVNFGVRLFILGFVFRQVYFSRSHRCTRLGSVRVQAFVQGFACKRLGERAPSVKFCAAASVVL